MNVEIRVGGAPVSKREPRPRSPEVERLLARLGPAAVVVLALSWASVGRSVIAASVAFDRLAAEKAPG